MLQMSKSLVLKWKSSLVNLLLLYGLLLLHPEGGPILLDTFGEVKVRVTCLQGILP